MKAISCGVIIIDEKTHMLLACHPSHHPYIYGHWDIPKGHVERYEEHYETALRELYEESGIRLKKEDLYDCGMFEYTKYKDLHVYVAKTNVDLSKLTCCTYFNVDGMDVPEVDNYKLIPYTEVDHYYRSLRPIVKYCLIEYIKSQKPVA